MVKIGARLFITVMVAAATHALFAQDPGSDPELTGDGVARRGESLLGDAAPLPEAARPAESPRFEPSRPHRPGGAAGPGQLSPDGSFLVEQAGELRASAAGAWIFAPDPGDNGVQVRPMIVLPSQILGRLQRVVGPDALSARVRLTGRVTLFYKQNYVLVTAIGDQTQPPQAPVSVEEPENARDQEPNDEPADSNNLSPSVESLISELEAERTGVRAVIAGIGAGDGAALAPIAEGRTISRRRARFVRLDAGELALAFDNDDAGSSQDTRLDAPLVIAPCSLLESIEATLETHGDAMTATVSGQTLAFAGRSFILPISVVIDRPSELDSRQ
ncbi:MAG: hypothetical protein AAGJ54_07670 [Planctomycetota bacterium]